MQVSEQIRIMQDFLAGKQIEVQKAEGGKWYPAEISVWNWQVCNYRVKPMLESNDQLFTMSELEEKVDYWQGRAKELQKEVAHWRDREKELLATLSSVERNYQERLAERDELFDFVVCLRDNVKNVLGNAAPKGG